MKWTIWRHGYNAANNSVMSGGPEEVVVAVVEADTEEDALRFARKRVSYYNNQYLWAEEQSVTAEREAEIEARVQLVDDDYPQRYDAERHHPGCSCGRPDCSN